MSVYSLKLLKDAVDQASLVRIRLRLSPANDDGLVYPPTYESGKHIFRPAWIDGVERQAVLLDSVQSQANRLEFAILEATKRGEIPYPDINIDIDASTGHETYSVLELSHRIYDAALRACMVDGKLFPETKVGKAVADARQERATALFEHAPLMLLLGGWDSHSGGGPLVAKLPRLITSEVIGLDAKLVERGAVKFDPMDIRKSAGPVYESSDPQRLYETDPASPLVKDAKKTKKPSEVGLGNVPAYRERGAVITEARMTSLLSLTGLRRLRFPDKDNKSSNTRDKAGRVATAALGVFALASQIHTGFCFRSGCDLIPLESPIFEIVGTSLADIHTPVMDYAAALAVLQEALGEAKKQKLEWRTSVIRASADERLVTLVENSRRVSDREE